MKDSNWSFLERMVQFSSPSLNFIFRKCDIIWNYVNKNTAWDQKLGISGSFFFSSESIKHPYSSFTHKLCMWVKSSSLENDLDVGDTLIL